MDVTRLNTIINVADFDEVVAFYRDVLGLVEEESWDGPNGPGIILRAGEGKTLEFFGPPFGARTDKRPVAGIELAFDVTGLDEWAEQLRSKGVEIRRRIKENPWGDRSFGIDDPAGVRIWFVEPL